MSETLLVITTLPDEEQAKSLAHVVISEQLAACVNILPRMTSIYQWKGNIETGTEHLLLIKTQDKHYSALETTIMTSHPYELPEIIAVPVNKGLPEYLTWIQQQTS